MLSTMGEKNKPEREHNYATNLIHSEGTLDDRSILSHLSTDDLQPEDQKLYKAYQNMKYERDILRKALNVYHKGLRVPDHLSSLGFY